MRLCFGVLATLLKLSFSSSSNKKVVSDLVSTIDPGHLIDSDGAVSKLINCKTNFPDKDIAPTMTSIRETRGALTAAVQLSYDTDPADLAKKFEQEIIRQISADKKVPLIGALHYVIKSDGSIRSENTLTFEKCMGMQLKYVLSTAIEVSLPQFLAGLFLYTLQTNKNSLPECEDTLKEIRDPVFMESFRNYQVTYIDEVQKGFTPAPDVRAEYLARLQDKYDRITALIYRGVPHPFYDLYVPGTLKWDRGSIDVPGITGLLKVSRDIVFTGIGGRGKSMLMRHLLLDAAVRYHETGLVPIFISVKDFDGRIPDILQCSHVFIRSLWPELSTDELQTIFIDGKALLLFDGLDEIRPGLLSVFTSALNSFLDRYPDNAIFLSSRPYSNFASFSRFTPVSLEPFSVGQAASMISKLDYPADDPELNREFREMLEGGLYETHMGLADNPLLLTIMLMTYAEYHEIPSYAHQLFERAFYVLAKLHDDSKDNFTRDLATGWSVDTFADRFAYFCARTYRDGLTTFSRDEIAKYYSMVARHYGEDGADASRFIKDLCNSICLMTEDNGRCSFIHRSFQEYFCARFLYMQDGAQLRKVIPLFDRIDETRLDDRTLRMLYEMEPEEVQRHIFLPYLEKLVGDCCGADGIWVFLKQIYGHLDCADGDRKALHPYPDSLLYSTLCSVFHIEHKQPEPGAYPVLDQRSMDVFVRRADTGEVVNLRRLPPEYTQEHGSPEVTGRLYRFDWDALQDSDEVRKAVMDPSGPFVNELEAVMGLYEKLKSETSSKDEADPFEDMF